MTYPWPLFSHLHLPTSEVPSCVFLLPPTSAARCYLCVTVLSATLQKAGVDRALRGSDRMTKFARAANTLILSIVRPLIRYTLQHVTCRCHCLFQLLRLCIYIYESVPLSAAGEFISVEFTRLLKYWSKLSCQTLSSSKFWIKLFLNQKLNYENIIIKKYK